MIGQCTLDEIVGVFDAHRDADEVIRQAACCAYLSGYAGVAHEAGQANQGNDVAEADGYLKELGLLHDHRAGLQAM